MTEWDKLLLRTREWLVENGNASSTDLLHSIEEYLVKTFGMNLPEAYAEALRYQGKKSEWRQKGIDWLKDYLDSTGEDDDED